MGDPFKRSVGGVCVVEDAIARGGRGHEHVRPERKEYAEDVVVEAAGWEGLVVEGGCANVEG